jgi:predicted O-methyltransferase YrrM
MKTNSRKVSEIARYSAVPAKYGLLLSNLASEFGKPAVVEFGTSLGISAMYLAAGCPGTVVYTMEGCPETSLLAEENFSNGGFNNINLMNGAFDDLLPELKKKNIKPGLVFIDGNHKKEPVCRYFREVSDMSDNKAVIVIDDIHYSQEMEDAWKEIMNSVNVTLSVDLYRMGIVFFRKGMAPSGYTIRY